MSRTKALVGAVVVLLFGVSAVTSLASPPAGKALKGSAPPWAKSAGRIGAADADTAVGFRVYLGWRSGAEQAAQAVSDPTSPLYRRYYSPAKFRAAFAPSQAAVGAVQSWLRSQGFSVDYTPANNHYVQAEGTVAQAEAAFGTSFGVYQVDGQSLRSPDSDLTVPAAIADTVSGVVGLDQSWKLIRTDHVIDGNAPPSPGFRNAPPLSSFWNQFSSPYAYPTGFTNVTTPATVPWAVKGYTPAQIKGAYGISDRYDGSGQTVAIIDAFASPTILQDVNRWSINRGLPAMNPGQLQQVVPPGIFNKPQGPQQDPQGWYGEQTLDIEAVHGMAPAAKIVYVGAPNSRQDLDAAMNFVVDRGLAQIVSNSYGFSTEMLPTGYIKPLNDTFVQAAAEGIGVYFSSGDDGDETSTVGYATPDWPASSPWVTAVGGTSLAVDSANARVFETGWGTSDYNCDSATLVCTRTGWLYGAGGGESKLFPRPWYQTGVSGAGRSVPDVAALADPQTGMLVGQTQTFPDGAQYDEYRIGGTSLAAPIFSGLMALADQAAGQPFGFANPAFYSHSDEFTDVGSVKTAVARRNFNNGVDAAAGTGDHLRTFDDYSGSPTQHTNPGWDNVTGLGVPDGIFHN